MLAALIPSRQQRWTALAVSAAVHATILWWFWTIPLTRYAVPAAAQKNPEPFKVRRIEMSGGAWPSDPTPGPRFTASPATDPTPSPEMSSHGQVAEQALRAQEAHLPLPSPAQVPLAQSQSWADSAAGASTPYALSDQAKLEAEIAKFALGPQSSGAPSPGTHATSEGGGPDQVEGLGGRAGLAGPPQSGPSGVPGFQDIQADLRPMTPSLRAPEFEPMLLRLPSDIVFDFDSAKLSSQAEPLLQQASALIQKTPRAEILVEGHTDTIGTEDYNLKLSQQRAENAAAWFRQKLSSNTYRIVSKGYGESRPMVNPTGNIDEQKANRRVEITIQSLPR